MEDNDLPPEELSVVRADRIGENVAGDTVTLATANYPEHQRNLVRWIHGHIKDKRIKPMDVQRLVKIDHSTLWKVWNDKYRDANGERVSIDQICAKIERYHDLVVAREHIVRTPFFETSVWERVSKHCNDVLRYQDIGFIYGPSQIGKTACLVEVARRDRFGQTIYVLTPAAAGVQSMLKAIAEALHISVRTTFDQLRDRVRNALDGSKLILMDEVHEVFLSYQKSSTLKCMAVLRQLQEVTRCGMVLCGTEAFRNELERGEFRQSLLQLRRRGTHELQLEPSPTDHDLNLIAESFGLSEPSREALDLVIWIAQEKGFGQYIKFLTRASELAAKRKEKFAWSHFVHIFKVYEKLRQKAQSQLQN